MKKVNAELSSCDFFYFYSKMYTQAGRCVKQKLFIEFLENLQPRSSKTRDVVNKILAITQNSLSEKKIFKMLAAIDARISLISIEPNNVLTFYLRAGW